MNKMEKVVVAAANHVYEALLRRRFDEKRRYCEGLVAGLFVHELIKKRPDWRERLWSEVRPFPKDDKQRIDFWVNRKGAEPALALELKVADPDFKWGNGKYAIRGGVVNDFLKLADTIKSSSLRFGYVLLLGRTDYLNDDTVLCDLAMREDYRRFLGRPAALLPTKGEQYYAGLNEWFTPGSRVPRRIVVRRVHSKVGTSTGLWLWRVDLPRARRRV